MELSDKFDHGKVKSGHDYFTQAHIADKRTK